jgi:hypothetical protein
MDKAEIPLREEIPLSPLSFIFTLERHQDPHSGVVPAFSEIEVAEGSSPLLASNMRGTFVRTRRTPSGFGRFGYSECLLSQEGAFLGELHRVLKAISVQEGWSNRAADIDEGLTKMISNKIEPKVVIISSERSNKDKVQVGRNVQLLAAPIPPETALITTLALYTGYYTRIGDYVGILAQNIDRAFMVVG